MTESEGPKDKMYRVVWVSEETEFQSHGGPLTKEDAEAAAKSANQKYPNISHEVVPVDEEDKPDNSPGQSS